MQMNYQIGTHARDRGRGIEDAHKTLRSGHTCISRSDRDTRVARSDRDTRAGSRTHTKIRARPKAQRSPRTHELDYATIRSLLTQRAEHFRSRRCAP